LQALDIEPLPAFDRCTADKALGFCSRVGLSAFEPHRPANIDPAPLDHAVE
jgi:hypothetical protein